jgi:hypothetical protein
MDRVQLHPGTIINPTGITLSPGMVVSILGYNSGPYFDANEIDTPYTFSSGVPYYSGHPWWYWGPTVSFTFFFGNHGWWHGHEFYGGGYHYNGGVRYYDNVDVRHFYNSSGGSWHGREWIAPRSHGGYYHGDSHQEQHGNGWHGGGDGQRGDRHSGGHGERGDDHGERHTEGHRER